MKRILAGLFVISTLGAIFYSLFRIISTSAPDFGVYYYGAQFLKNGRSLYDNPGLYTGIGYPPQTLLLFLPFTLFPYGLSQAVWIILSYISLAVSIAILVRMFYPKITVSEILMIIGAAGLTFPVKFSLGMGQSNLIALGLLTGFIYQFRKNRIIAAAAFLGTATVLKPQLLIIFLALILLRKWKTGFVAGGIHLIAVISTGMLFGWNQFTVYLLREVPYMSLYRGPEIYYNQGIRAMVSRILPDSAAPGFISFLSAVIITITVYVIIVRKFDLIRAVLMLLPTFLLIEPLSWQHHYIFLIPTVIYLAGELYRTKNFGYFLFAIIFISVNLDLSGRTDLGPAGFIILSHTGIGNLIIYLLSVKYL
jgi:hypothetical protein